jgi:cytochrome c556
MRPILLTTLAAAAALAGVAVAQSPAANVRDSINARQTHYKEIGKAFKAMLDETKKTEVDKAVMTKNADTLALYAPQINGWFPKGSGSEAGLKTGAKAEIWSDPKGFLDQTKKFEERTRKFQAIAHNGDVAEMKTFLPQLGGACKSCHDRFRVKDHD